MKVYCVSLILIVVLAIPTTYALFQSKSEKEIFLRYGQIYHLNCSSVGSFHIKGGSTGNLSISGKHVQILDSFGNIIFSGGGEYEIVQINDYDAHNQHSDIENQKNEPGTLVSLVPQLYPAKFERLLQRLLQFWKKETLQPLQIKAIPNKVIVVSLEEQRNVTISGDGYGANLILKGITKVFVNCSVKGIESLGSTSVIVEGSVLGGGIRLLGIGDNVEIYGNVHGNIVLSSSWLGILHVRGRVWGNVILDGVGGIVVDGEVNGNVKLSGMGIVVVRHESQGDGYEISNTGLGYVRIGDKSSWGLGPLKNLILGN